MLPDSQKLLSDMLVAGRAIMEFTCGKTVSDLATDRLLRAGIYYEFVVIGEALARLRQSDVHTAERISEHARIIAFRNQIIHGYAIVDDEITWRIIETKLPVLIGELEQMPE
jgi:uncharacterized protein with HEPN domain